DDDEHLPALVGRRSENQRHPVLQPQVGSDEASGVPALGVVPAQVASCPSLQRFGVMNENSGVVACFEKSSARCPANVSGAPFAPTVTVPSGTTCSAQRATPSITECMYRKPTCRVAY